MLRVTYFVKNSLYKKEETKQKDKKLVIHRVHKFSESPLMKLTELHRNSCGWLRPWNSFDQSFLSLRLSLVKSEFRAEVILRQMPQLTLQRHIKSISKHNKEKSGFLSIHFGQCDASEQMAYQKSCKANHKMGPRPQEVMSHTSVCNGERIADGDRQ